MKCPHCSAALYIEDEYCRYCGNKNPYFTEHREKMQEFTDEFVETQQTVVQSAKRTTRFTAGVAIICILIALNLGLLLAHANAWGITKLYNNWYLNNHETEIRAELEAFSDAGDLAGMYYYYETVTYCASYDNCLSDYDAVGWGLNCYTQVQGYMVDLVFFDEDGYYTTSELAANISDYLEWFYKYTLQDEYDDEEDFNAEHQATIDLTTERLETLLSYYLNISPEEIPEMMELSDAARTLMIEERALGYED